jgi:conjugal transfer ATP-binding protein TraC
LEVIKGIHDLGAKLSKIFGEPKDSKGPSPEAQEFAENAFSNDLYSKILPYQVFDSESGLFIGQKSMGFVLESLPLVGCDLSVQKEISSIFDDLMEEGSSIQCLLWGDPRTSDFIDFWEKPHLAKGGIHEALARKRAKYLKESSKVTARNFRFMMSYSIPISNSVSSIEIDRMKGVREKMKEILGSQTYTFSWNAEHFVKALDGLVNFTLSSDSSVRKWDEHNSLSEQVPSGGAISVEEDQISIKNETSAVFKSYRVIDYPDSWSLSRMQNLIGDFNRENFRINAPFLIHYGVHCPNQDKQKSSFWRKRQIVENQGRSPLLRKYIPKLEKELEEYAFAHKMLNEESRFVSTQLSVGVWAEPEKLPSVEQTLKSLFRINQFNLRENICLQLPQFLAFLPMSWGEYAEEFKKLNLLKTTISSECGNLVPLLGEWLGTPSPGMLLLGRRGQLLNWNPFDNQSGNYNCVIAGRSGSGKSVFMQDLLMSSMGNGARVFILDVGRSYEKMSNLLGGQQVEFSNESNLCLNPFTHISCTDERERDQSFGMLKSIISTMAAPSGNIGDYEKALIEKSIRSVWELKKNKATITDVAQYLIEQKGDSKARDISVMLTPFCKGGVYAYYFEGDNNIDFTSDLVLIELEELKEKKDLQTVVLQIFIMTITNITFLGDRSRPFHICIDEAWDLLRGGMSGEFIETLARRLRKYRGSLVVGTQSIDDFYSTPGACAAYENSDWVCLLSQKKSSISRLKENNRFDVDDHQQMALESVHSRHGEYSEIMICDSSGGYSIGRLVLDPFSCLLYSTKAEDYANIKNLQSQGYSVTESIERLI